LARQALLYTDHLGPYFVQIFDKFYRYGITGRNVRRVVRNTNGARREALRACIFHLAARITPLIGVEDAGVRYVLSPREPTGVCRSTFLSGSFDEEIVLSMIAALAQHAGMDGIEGLTVLEVGANIGTETVSLLARHGVERIMAIEPGAENVRFLRANLALNGLQDRVTIYEMALSDVDRIVELERSEENWGDHRVRSVESFGPDLREEGLRSTSSVQARRLDSLLDTGEIDIAAIDLMWMDVQGHEGQVLRGAERLTGIPIVTEYWPYGLRRTGALDAFHELIADRFSLIVDLHEPAMVLTANRVAELADRYEPEKAADPVAPYTDLLLLPTQAELKERRATVVARLEPPFPR
jgi:FkbM family methyltransferase